MYDAVVAGGSISGLLCAREIARGGYSVLVLEDDYEVGTPEHCSGLVSGAGLDELGIIPSQKTFGCMVAAAELFAPGGGSVVLDAARQKVFEVSRRELDKQAARQAQKNGAVIRVGAPVREIVRGEVRTRGGGGGGGGGEAIRCRIAVDARGVSSLIRGDRDGALASAQYEVYAGWVVQDRVRLYFDQKRYPGFFAWIIPSGEGGRAKAGVAGRGINAAAALDAFLEGMGGDYSVVRRVFAPVWVKGPVGRFVDDGRDTVVVGDAAGQTKPTTAGGIYTAGMGGVLAGRAISRYLETGDRADLDGYQARWTAMFGREFERQLAARRILERLDNGALDRLFAAVTPKVAAEISGRDDFDFHAGSIVRMLGVRGSLGAAGALIGSEARRLFSAGGDSNGGGGHT